MWPCPCPADLLGADNRTDVCRFFHEVLGFEEMEVMTEDRRRLILSCVHWDQFIFLISEDDPMRCPRMDHYGFAVGSLDELKGIQERAESFRKTTTAWSSSTCTWTTSRWSRSTPSTFAISCR